MPTYNDGVISGGSLATAGNTAVAAAVWDRAKTSHTTAGTYGGDMVTRVIKTMTFADAAGTGAVGNVPLFTVTGSVQIVSLVPTCTTDLTGATATLALGVTGNTALFIAATTATDIDAGELWVDTAPDANGVAVPAALKDIVIADNDEIVGTVAVAAITGGVIAFVVEYVPLTSGSGIVAA